MYYAMSMQHKQYATQAAQKEQALELPYRGCKAMLQIEVEWITSQYEQRVIDAATYTVMKQYIKEKFQWGEDEFNITDWNEIEQARKGCTKNENVKITKLMYDWVNTGHQKSKMDQDEICPCCGIEEETLEHMY